MHIYTVCLDQKIVIGVSIFQPLTPSVCFGLSKSSLLSVLRYTVVINHSYCAMLYRALEIILIPLHYLPVNHLFPLPQPHYST